MKKYLLLTLLSVVSVTLYTADYNPDAKAVTSSSKRFQNDDDDDTAINTLAAQLRQEAEEDQAITSLAASLREECESNKLDTAALGTQLPQITAPDIAAELQQAVAIHNTDAQPALKPKAPFKEKKLPKKNKFSKKNLAEQKAEIERIHTLIGADDFKERVRNCLDETKFFKDNPEECTASCTKPNSACKTIYSGKHLADRKKCFISHCISQHLTLPDFAKVHSVIKLSDQKNKYNRYHCNLCPTKASQQKSDALQHAVLDHILKEEK